MPSAADPIRRFLELFAEAQDKTAANPEAVTLATADARSRPSARVVLLKGVDAEGFVFFTNFASRKARELAVNPWGALCFYWPELGSQVRVDGQVARVSDEESDAYFATRPRPSQIAAWASHQSHPVASRQALDTRFAEVSARFGDGPVPRPPFWGGYRLAPERIEFWTFQEHRLHDRELYVRSGDAWQLSRLWP